MGVWPRVYLRKILVVGQNTPPHNIAFY